jgi:hypothetical protein
VISGVAIAMRIKTSTGDWQIKKELVIRKAFANTESKAGSPQQRPYFLLS